MHHLTLQRLCEHSLALSKLTFCPLKDYHCDRIDKTLVCLVLAVSYFIIFTNRAVQRCRWGGQCSTQTNTCSPGLLSDSFSSILHTVREESAEGSGFKQPLPYSSQLDRLPCIIPKERKRNKEDYETQEVYVWQIVCEIHFQHCFTSCVCDSLNVIGNMQLNRPKAGSLKWTYLLLSHV